MKEQVSSRTLIKAQRNVAVPFDLDIRISDGRCATITFEKIFRLLPGKRIVALATHQGKPILVKTFLGRTARRYARKERTGVQLIGDAGLRTPELLWEAKVTEGYGRILAFEYLEDSKSLQERWEEAKGDDERVDVLTRAMIIIAKMHNQGIVQTDIHLANFLMSQRRIFTIDGGGIVRRSAPPLAEAASLENLSWFFAQFYPKYDEFVQVVLPAYDAIRGWHADPARVASLHKEINKSRESRKRYYLEKAFRDCTRFVCESHFSRFMVCERQAMTPELEDLLQDPDRYMAKGKLLKDGNSATVVQVDLPGRSLVVKRYNIKNPWHGLLRAFQRSRAWASWENAFHMEFLGIRSLKPVAMIENRFGPLRRNAYFITDYVEGPDALAFLRGLQNPESEPEALVALLIHLSRSRIAHGDLKATNFLMAEDGPVIIDLDAMREYRDNERFRKAFDKDIARFMKNWEDQPELANRFQGLLKQFTG